MPETLHDQLTSYLTDAHSIEEQALAQLRSIPALPGADQLRSVLVDHLAETEGHERTVKDLLGHRDAKPSWFKDAVMKIGGKGFVWFARANEDTPGKLLAHAYSYEALEEASYALLGDVAEHAGENDVAASARKIEAEEAAMKERLAACFDEGAEASLAAIDPSDLQAQVAAYLADAHAIEQQSITVLERAGSRESGSLATAYEHHLGETRAQAARIEARLAALGHDGSKLKDTALRMAGMNWTAFFEAHPDTPGKIAAFAYALEHLEIGGYEQLRRVAERADDHETAELAQLNLGQERAAAKTLYGLLPEAAELALS
jgi:ferritin-like metal-binding protein YciE